MTATVQDLAVQSDLTGQPARPCPHWYGRLTWGFALASLMLVSFFAAAWAGSVYFSFGVHISALVGNWRQHGFYVDPGWFMSPEAQFPASMYYLFGALTPVLILAACRILRHRPGRDAYWLACVLGLATGLRLACVLLVPYTPVADFAVYHQSGVNMAREWTLLVPAAATYRCFFPPGQVFTIGVLYRLFGADPLWPQLLNCVYSVATVAGVWYIANRWFGSFAARAASLIAAILPSTVFGCLLIGAEVSQTFWLVLAICIYVRWVDEAARLRWAVLCGMCLGIGALIRPTYVLLPAAIGLHLLLSWTNWRKAVLTATVLAAGVAMAVLPWTARNYAVTGGFMLISSNGGGNLYSANNPQADGGYTTSAWIHVFDSATDDLSLNRIGMECGKEWILQHPRDFAFLAGQKLARFWESDKEVAWWATSSPAAGGRSFGVFAESYSDGFYFGCLIAAAIGLWRFRRQLKADRGWMIVPIMAACFTAVHMVFESQGKYHYMLAPLIAVFAALAAGGPVGSKTRQNPAMDRPAAG